MIVFLFFIYGCVVGIQQPPQIIGKKVDDASIAEGISSENIDIKIRSYILLFSTSSDQEFAFWWPKLLQEKDTEVQLDVFSAVIPKHPDRVFVVSFYANPSLTMAQKCQVLLIGHRHGIALDEFPESHPKTMNDRLYCSLLQQMRQPDKETSLSSLVENETLPLDLSFYHELYFANLVKLSPSLQSAYQLAEEYYRIPLACVWMLFDSENRPKILGELLEMSEIERMEAVDFLWTIRSPVAVEVLKKFAGVKDDAGRFAKLALVSKGKSSANFAVQVLQDREETNELRIASAKSLGAFLTHKKNVAVEKALVSAFTDEQIEVSLAAIRAAGQAKLARAWRELSRIETNSVRIQIEIDGALRAISATKR